jgi:hypothetical protein
LFKTTFDYGTLMRNMYTPVDDWCEKKRGSTFGVSLSKHRCSEYPAGIILGSRHDTRTVVHSHVACAPRQSLKSEPRPSRWPRQGQIPYLSTRRDLLRNRPVTSHNMHNISVNTSTKHRFRHSNFWYQQDNSRTTTEWCNRQRESCNRESINHCNVAAYSTVT